MKLLNNTLLMGALACACSSGADSADDTQGGTKQSDDGAMASADDMAADTANDPAGSGAASLGAPAPCSSNDDCPQGIECFKLDPSDAVGYCDVDDTVVSPDAPMDAGASTEVSSGGVATLAAPAICMSDADCPDGIECAMFDDSSDLGYCNVADVAVQ
jgi:hypothetical protein